MTLSDAGDPPLSPPTSGPISQVTSRETDMESLSQEKPSLPSRPRKSFSKNINPESSRSVLFMAADKLERKRKLDRHNQRTSRAKTRARVEELEKENEHLKCQLDAAERSKTRMQSTLERMKNCIRSSYAAMMDMDELGEVHSSIESPASSTGAARSRSLTNPQALVWPSHQTSKRRHSSAVRPRYVDGSHADGRGQSSSDENTTMQYPLDVLNSGHSNSSDALPPTWSFTDALAGFKYDVPARPSPQNQPILDLGALDFTFGAINQDIEPNPDPSVDEPWSGSLEQALHHVRRSSRYSISPPDLPIWSIPIKHLPPQNQLDRLMQSMADTLAANSRGMSSSGIHTPTFPSVQSLLNLDVEEGDEDQSLPVSTALFEHGSSWTAFRGFPEKIAILHCIGRLVRWQVQPNRANWDALMPGLRPTDAQRNVPHPWWVDTLQWGRGRDHIIEQKNWAIFHQLRGVFNANFSINWPHSPHDILVPGAQGEMVPSPAFLEHIRDTRNWTIDAEWPEELAFMREIAPKQVAEL